MGEATVGAVGQAAACGDPDVQGLDDAVPARGPGACAPSVRVPRRGWRSLWSSVVTIQEVGIVKHIIDEYHDQGRQRFKRPGEPLPHSRM